MRHTINLDCKTHHISKDNSFPLLLRVSLNGEQDYFNTGRRVNAKHYDKKAKKIKKFKGSSSIENLISIHKQRIQSIIDLFDRKGEILSLSKLKELYYLETNGTKKTCFYEYVKNRIEWEKVHTKTKPNTYKFIEGNLFRLQEYKPKLSIYDLDDKFLDDYKAYLLNTKGYRDNTVYHALCFCRKYVKQLVVDGLINKNPFDKVKVGSPFESELVYLEPEELKILHDLYDSKSLLNFVRKKESKYAVDFNVGEKYQEVLKYFLVACYTGLRHSDIKTLKREHIVGNQIEKKLIKGSVGREKTVRIPIHDSLNSLIDNQNNNGLLFENPVMENSQTNKYLLEIMKIANIDKHITFHKARYTFGIISLILGVSIDIVSDVLGHSELSTTQRYAKVVDAYRNRQMGKWSNFRSYTIDSNKLILYCSNCNQLLLDSWYGIISQKFINCVCPNCNNQDRFETEKMPLNIEIKVPVFESC